ncbi:hypothetical protein EVAR_22079_1 [Eumeta japonica]|uniref:Uncharacterized protein n=1 Tax=Eumeta variegata TaxID=151549 RepID=A0A4C1UTW1_EUMVA|nr:hypothetical protein EVAR_22079_1 [Eumeta japonica]
MRSRAAIKSLYIAGIGNKTRAGEHIRRPLPPAAGSALVTAPRRITLITQLMQTPCVDGNCEFTAAPRPASSAYTADDSVPHRDHRQGAPLPNGALDLYRTIFLGGDAKMCP